MIGFEHLTKRFGSKIALNDVSFTAENGKVTGFLGPNGAGKSTSMRAALGLIHADSGQVLIDGKRYSQIPSPMACVGAVLDAKSAHRGRSALNHLYSMALTNHINKHRVEEVIDITGLNSVMNIKAGKFSLGMNQRLSIAAALLGDPHNLILDEPINGLDPEGIQWVRNVCRYYADQGRAVLLSSHLMSEVALTADNLVIIAQGNILHTGSVKQFIEEHSTHALRIITPQEDQLRAMIAQQHPEITIVPYNRTANEPQSGTALRLLGGNYQQLAYEFAHMQLVMYQFVEEQTSLEEAYMELTHMHAQYTTAAVPSRNGSAVNLPRKQEN